MFVKRFVLNFVLSTVNYTKESQKKSNIYNSHYVHKCTNFCNNIFFKPHFLNLMLLLMCINVEILNFKMYDNMYSYHS